MRRLVKVYEDAGASGKSMNGRPGLAEALGSVDAGKADGLVIAKLDRLSRSLLDFAGLMKRSRERGWQLVALDLGVDTSTPTGEMVANIMASLAEWERRMIGERTKTALAEKRAEGVRLGRPRTLPEEVRSAIVGMKRAGSSLSAIARELNEQGIPTAHQGARWYPSTVRAVLRAA